MNTSNRYQFPIKLTCVEYKDCGHFCPLLEKDICHYPYPGLVAMETRIGHLSASTYIWQFSSQSVGKRSREDDWQAKPSRKKD